MFKRLSLLVLFVALFCPQAAWGMYQYNREAVQVAQQLDAVIQQLNLHAGGNLNGLLQQMERAANAQRQQAQAQADGQERVARARAEAENAPARLEAEADRLRAQRELEAQRAEDARRDAQARIERMGREAAERLRIDREQAAQRNALDLDREHALHAQRIQHAREQAEALREVELAGLREKVELLMREMPELFNNLPALADALGGHMERAQVGVAEANGRAAVDVVNAKWAGIQNIVNSIGRGLSNPKGMAITATAVMAVIGAYYGWPVMWSYIEASLKRPRIVSETSRGGILGGEKSEITSINDTIVDPETSAQLKDIVDRITMAREEGENLFNVMFYGVPGTGKTMFAKALAYHSGLDYAIMSGSEFTKITDTNIAISELQKLVRWAEHCPKGLLIFIDEAESFLADRRLPSTTKWAQDLLNAFLAAVPKPTSKKMMFVFATNHPFKLDKAVLSRIGERIEFKLPALPEREKILKMYLGKFGQEKGVVLTGDFAKNITEVAQQLEGIAPRELEYIAEKMTQIAKQSGSKTKDGKFSVLSKQTALSVADLMKKSIQQSNKWEEEQQNWVDRQVAVAA